MMSCGHVCGIVAWIKAFGVNLRKERDLGMVTLCLLLILAEVMSLVMLIRGSFVSMYV